MDSSTEDLVGLPEGWTVTVDGGNGKRWIAPDPDNKEFVSLSKALEYVNGNDTISNADTSVSKTDLKNASDASYTVDKLPSHSDITAAALSKKSSKKRSMSNSSSSRKKQHERKKSKASISSTRGKKRKTPPLTPPSPSEINSKSVSKSSSKEIKSSFKSSIDHESDPEISLDIPHDYDESNSSSNRKYNRCIGTVHWDPNSIEGSKVGHRIRVYEYKNNSKLSSGHWKHGRVIRYDPISHKHKIVFFGLSDDDDDEEQWLMLKDENYQLGGDFVWALVRGYPWWPAQVLHCHFGRAKPNAETKDLTTQPVKNGFVLVEFFDSDEVAAIRNTPDFLRPFQKGVVDEVIKKNKKKRNVKAIESGLQEEIATQEVRNDAARFYAESAFKCANRKANYYLGMKVEVFRSDINYPIGVKLVGTVRQYSLTAKKWLIAYDPFPVNEDQYSPSWINLLNKSSSFKIIDPIRKRKFYEPNKKDIFPFLFGCIDQDFSTINLCRGCVADCSKEIDTVLKCAECMSYYHPICVDPLMNQRTAENIIKSGERWVCNKCVRCVGCRELEIAFGTKTIPQPSSLFMEGNMPLNLCNACIPMYEKEMYCPACAHIWDDTRFQRIRKRLQKQNNKLNDDKLSIQSSNERMIDSHKDENFQWMSPSHIDDSWFYPEQTNVWGYNEDSMLYCEQCNLWVHAGCAQLSKSEYSLTNEGEHPIYSQEFLCRTCCKRKCLTIMNQLVDEDKMGLFAEPVTDKVAHNYSDIIKNPMDLSTMMTHAQKGSYRNYAWLRESFELMVLNALTFNHGYTTYWNEAKRFYKVCKKIFISDGKGAPPSKYYDRITERFEIARMAVQAEKERVKTDDTAEKKDLIAGSLVLKVKLGPLDKPIDPPSCVPCFEVRLSPTEALFCSWMECCFTCGSSGAADTFLFCVDCGEAYHSFCCMAPIHSMNEAAVNGWRCPNCKLCEISGEVTSDETKLIYCEMCDRAFSLDFIEPPLQKVPSGLWICGQCVDCVECHNTRNNGKVSRACWSKEPSMCRACISEIEKKPKKEFKASTLKPTSIEKKTSDKKQPQKLKKKFTKKLIDEKSGKKKKKRKKPKVLREKESKPIVKLENKTEEKKLNIRTESLPSIEPQDLELVLRNRETARLQVALLKAMNEAKSRGLPDGWTCFYGAANRKRWRSPHPHQRVFESIPKALEYAERMKMSMGLQSKRQPFILFNLNLNELQLWRERETGYDENTSLMSDAECLFRILEPKLGYNFGELFDPEKKTISASVALKKHPVWVFQRAARFVRFVKRLSKRNENDQGRSRGIDKVSQNIVCRMASAFIYVICRIFNLNIVTTIKYSEKVLELLLHPDQECGTLPLNDEERRQLSNTRRQTTWIKTPLSQQILSPATSNNITSSTRINIQVSQQNSTLKMPSKLHASGENKSSMSAQDYDVANVLLGLTSPKRSKVGKATVMTMKPVVNVPNVQNKSNSKAITVVEKCTDTEKKLLLVNELDPHNKQAIDEKILIEAEKMANATNASHPIVAKVEVTVPKQRAIEQPTVDKSAPTSANSAPVMPKSSERDMEPVVKESDSNSSSSISDSVIVEKCAKEAVELVVDAHDTNYASADSAQATVEQHTKVALKPIIDICNSDTKDAVVPVVHIVDTNNAQANVETFTEEAVAPNIYTTDSIHSCIAPPEVGPKSANNKVQAIVENCMEKAMEVIANASKARKPLTRIEPIVNVRDSYIAEEILTDLQKTNNIQSNVEIPPGTHVDTKAVEPSQQVMEPKTKNFIGKDSEDGPKIIPKVEETDTQCKKEMIETPEDIDTKKEVDDISKIDKWVEIEKAAKKQKVEDTNLENMENKSLKVDVVASSWLTSTLVKVHPMCGWSKQFGTGSSLLQEWKDPRVCCLCLNCGDDDAGVEPPDTIDGKNDVAFDTSNPPGAGRLLPLPSGGWIHVNCAIWSSEVWETLDDCILNDVYKARSRSSKLKCFGCGRPGATLGCNRKCVKNYHFACARASGVLFMDNHELYCTAHQAFAKNTVRADFSEPMKPLKIRLPEDVEVDRNLSIRVGSLVVHSLGNIQTEIDGFHSKYYITPPGFTSTRIFWSYIQPKSRTLYFMKIERSSKNSPLFVLTTADAPSNTFQSDDVSKVYAEVMQKVEDTNKDHFSCGDLCSIFPMKKRWKKGQKAFCLNGPQFWGFGVDNIRRALETLPEAVACAVPLTEKSTTYNFCFQNPTEEAVTELQRKRAAIKAEKALENATGCARTEGKNAVDKSTSSDRITRALVRKVEEEMNRPPLTKSGAKSVNDSSKQHFESNQAKYMEMKKYPMEQRLAAKRSHIHGWGLFAQRFFPKNSMIAEYMGETIGQTIADKREKKYEILGMGSCYMFRLDLHNIVDATNIGCMARFMNHCCAANAYAKVVTVNTSLGMEKKIVVFAKQDIQVGEEITYDYNFAVEDGSLRCTCGAPNCIGRMN